MLVGILKERQSGEARVAATPATVTQLRTLGYEVVVDPGAGVASSFPDAAYVEAGRDDRQTRWRPTSCSASTHRRASSSTVFARVPR